MKTSDIALTEHITNDLLPQKFGLRGKIWTAILTAICLVGAYAYFLQLRRGLAVTNMGDYVSWGIYISNFVFFVAISLVGSLITAVLRLANVHWSTPLTRIAEIIAVSAIVFASIIIIVDMGRPDRFYHLFIYGRLQSPILWDVIVIGTYLVISLMLLYLDCCIERNLLYSVLRSIFSISAALALLNLTCCNTSMMRFCSPNVAALLRLDAASV